MEADSDCMEIIHLDKKSKDEWTANENRKNVKFIEFNVQNSKIMSQQLKYDSSQNVNVNNENQKTVKFGKLLENRGFFSKLPPGTILIRHDNKSNETEKIFALNKEVKTNCDYNFDTQNEKRQRGVKNKK